MPELKSKILIADDEEIFLAAMSAMLESLGYDCVTVSDGTQVVCEALNSNPDLIVLDMLMPGVSGVEVCRQIKINPQLKDCPVIFITGAGDLPRVLEAFEAGAVDYITKPINAQEVAVRIRTQVELSHANRELAHYATSLEVLARDRARQLMHADRLATLGTLSAGVAHEINNPLTFISGNVQVIERFWEALRDGVEVAVRADPERAEKYRFILEAMPHIITGMKEGVARIVKIITSLKTYSKQGNAQKQPFRLLESLEGALQLCHKPISDGQVQLERRMDDPDILVYGDAQQIEQVLVNLITNAIDATTASALKRHPSLGIDISRRDGQVQIAVEDNGDGIDPEILPRIWDPFFTTKSPGKGTGLGLSIVRSIVEEHNGTIQARVLESGGMRFEVILPLHRFEDTPQEQTHH